MSVEAVNGSGGVAFFCEETSNIATISGTIFILIFVLSVTGNVLLLCVLFKFENLKNVTNLFILNLAVSDLIFTITLPFWAVYYLHHWIFGDVACKFLTAAYIVGLYSSVILLTAMTVDRFVAVVLHSKPSHPVKRQRCAVAACVTAWVISIGASVSDAVKVKVESHWNGVQTCGFLADDSSEDLGYFLQVSLLFILPFVIIVFCYSAILKTALHLQTSCRKKHQTVVVVLCIVIAFFICWGPYHVLLFMKLFYKPAGCDESERFYIAHEICQILAYSHCCMNPFLYMISQKMRKHLLQLLRCGKKKEKVVAQGTSVQQVAFIVQNSAITWDRPAE
ncbi:uncharacterized protein V6R79_005590 [Siganus canaliculatus]